MIDLTGRDKAEVLACLYNNSHAQGLGLLHAIPGRIMTRDQAQALLDTGQTYFDYIAGRPLKVDLSGDTLDPRLYDRDNGPGAAAWAIEWWLE